MMAYIDFAIVGILAFSLAFAQGVHTAICIVIALAALTVLFFINQITIRRVYVFKILGALFSALVISTLFTFPDEYGNPDLIWQLVAGGIAFVIILTARAKRTGLIRRDEYLHPLPPLQEHPEAPRF